MSTPQITGNPAFISRVPARTKLTAAERFFSSAVYAAEQADRAGLPVSVDAMAMFNPELKKTALADLLATDKFQRALGARGIRLNSTTGLSAEQLAAAAIYMDMTTPMSHGQKLRAAGITEGTWRGWLRQAPFAAHVSAISEDSLRASVPLALSRLTQLVDEKNLSAIDRVLEITGRHDRRKETIDINKLVMAIYNVLDEEIAPLPGGVAVLDRIVAKIRATMGAEQAPTLRIAPALPVAADTTASDIEED